MTDPNSKRSAEAGPGAKLTTRGNEGWPRCPVCSRSWDDCGCDADGDGHTSTGADPGPDTAEDRGGVEAGPEQGDCYPCPAGCDPAVWLIPRLRAALGCAGDHDLMATSLFVAESWEKVIAERDAALARAEKAEALLAEADAALAVARPPVYRGGDDIIWWLDARDATKTRHEARQEEQTDETD